MDEKAGRGRGVREERVEENRTVGDGRVSRAEALKVTGGAAAGLLLGPHMAQAATRITARADTRVVRCAIYPPIGIARVGNSPTDFFIGPEVPGVPANRGETYKDGHGRIKRQAARFRIYGFNAAGQVVRELTAHDADITWTVHLANTKAAWYDHKVPLDLPEAAYLNPKNLCRRRNATVKGADRASLAIDPGPRSIRGTSFSGSRYQFDSGTFRGRRVPLGEVRTDASGRLMVLGGCGSAGSYDNSALEHVSNNDGWHDDISDGPVTAHVVLGHRVLPVDWAWVVVAPPSYAPDISSIVTLYDIAVQAYLDAGRHTPGAVSFTRDIYPIFERFNRLQWVNNGFYKLYGWEAANDFLAPDYFNQLASSSAANAPFRKQVFDRFRNPTHADKLNAWPRIYGDSNLESDLLVANAPREHDFLTVTREQYRCLTAWAAGHFAADWNRSIRTAQQVEELPVSAQPGALARAALDACCGGPFHPGEELPWIMRIPSLYAGFCRLRPRTSHDGAEQDYGDVLTPVEAIGPHGPLHRSGPGDITRWMAVPWQADTANCGSAYTGTTEGQPVGDLPTFWPAVVPNRVMTEATYRKILEAQSTSDRKTAFGQRSRWVRHMPKEGPHPGSNASRNAAFVHRWSELGFVVERPGPRDAQFPTTFYVESETQAQ